MSPQQHPRSADDRTQPHHQHVTGDPVASPSAAAPVCPAAPSFTTNHASPRWSPPLNPNAAAFSSSGPEGTPDWLRFSPSSFEGGRFFDASPVPSYADVDPKGKAPMEAEDGPTSAGCAPTSRSGRGLLLHGGRSPFAS
jgi:hypothetical protein